ncbi:XdhC family protein [Lacimicrobium alkaliphilum]|uniref:Xanthine and CO dehydrogenase family maturation factor XdhC/CoxF family protein n=1 Tax=Lacimicrobium alkaliphilum TaxID=1526571 RepID=A0ABQ1RHE3_9ALTE|nr:XdhC/CoxI family protein [Lacimicrobium alkaliphilum]GGD68544.1 xanthine and CO dehydrogenase family maturation factor XdhC/CoxF family protein [Lacimicrobium alkaliphilum]
MSNQLNQLLAHWQQRKDDLQWVLATIIATEGSAYRKAGAMMLINSLGQYRGLLSGGCLEADIMRQARRCWDDGCNRTICYDMREEEDLAWQLGLGCGGMVQILLQPVSEANQYLQLDTLLISLQQHQPCGYLQYLELPSPKNQLLSMAQLTALLPAGCKVAQLELEGHRVLVQHMRPAPHLAVFGGGLDAIPVVAIARQLGWRITLVDPRPANAREAFFEGAQILRDPLSTLAEQPWLQTLDGAVVMNHNMTLDAEALLLLHNAPVRYLGLLGPDHRTEKVLKQAGLSVTDLAVPLASPVGLRLGGELPESIALAMISEMHAVLENKDARSISLQLESEQPGAAEPR